MAEGGKGPVIEGEFRVINDNGNAGKWQKSKPQGVQKEGLLGRLKKRFSGEKTPPKSTFEKAMEKTDQAQAILDKWKIQQEARDQENIRKMNDRLRAMGRNPEEEDADIEKLLDEMKAKQKVG